MNQHERTEDEGRDQVHSGRGWGSFAIGHGSDRCSGRVDVTLQVISPPGNVVVEWYVDDGRVADDVKERILSNANQILRWYLETHTMIGVRMTIDDASSDDSQRHDFDRATVVAIYSALLDASLPMPQIFDDES